jgi:hypothetical protein
MVNYDKREDFNFAILNFPHLDSNITTALAYGVYISQLICFAWSCSWYLDILQRQHNLSTKLY